MRWWYLLPALLGLVSPLEARAVDACDPSVLCAGRDDEACHADEGRCLGRTYGLEGCQRKRVSCGALNRGCWTTVGHCYAEVLPGEWEQRCTDLGTLCGGDRTLMCQNIQGACLARFENRSVCEAFRGSRHCGKILGLADPGCSLILGKCRGLPEAIRKARAARPPAASPAAAPDAPQNPLVDPVLGSRFNPGRADLTGSFPRPFLWGAATSSHQVEGDNYQNDWYAYEQMCRDPKLVGQVEIGFLRRFSNFCDRFELVGKALRHREPQVLDADLDRARSLHLNAHRFSLEWSRIQPAPDRFDEGVLRGYRRDLQAMRQRGLEPVVTLHHFTLPLWLSNPIAPLPKGNGFRNPDSVGYFQRFVRRVVSEYADLVRYWVTVNEPVGSEYVLGHVVGIWAPGRNGGGKREDALKNLALSHAVAYDEIHALYKKRALPRPMVGFAHAMMYVQVAPPLQLGPLTPDNTEAARNFNFFLNDSYLEALHRGCYRLRRSDSCDESLRERLRGRLDFVGLNFYRSVYVFRDLKVAMMADYLGGAIENDYSGSPFVPNTKVPHRLLNDLGWEINPDGFYRILRRIQELTGLPVLITENGLAQNIRRENPADDLRAPYLLAHLQSILRALQDGVRVFGYLHWSLVDNWELHEGYSPNSHFGLFAVDRSDCRAVGQGQPGRDFRVAVQGACTLPRRKTRGAEALADVARAGKITPEMLKQYGVISPDGTRVVRGR
jgi:beta-glucosidase